MAETSKTQGGSAEAQTDSHNDLLFLVTSVGLLLVAVALFAVLPASLPVASLRVPLLSGLAGLTLAAIGKLVVSAIQRETGREAERALRDSLNRLRQAVDQMEQIHFFHERGVEGIFANRDEAMPHFLKEIEREEKWVGIVGTSLLGAVDPSKRDEQKAKLTALLAKKRREMVRIDALIMHPAYGEFRERVENRSRAAVAQDIQRTLRSLIEGEELGAARDQHASAEGEQRAEPIFTLRNVKLYPGVVTAFAIFTTRAMLLNTSTLTGPVYDNVALIIRDTGDATSIYKRFRQKHFNEPWNSEKTIALTKMGLQDLITINFADDSCRFTEGNWPPTIADERTAALTLPHGDSDPSGVTEAAEGSYAGGEGRGSQL